MIESADFDALVARLRRFREAIPTSVRPIAVTKTVPSHVMRAAYAAGFRDFGENRIQEAETKQAELRDLTDVTWHLIGHLQSNKVQRAIELFDWIQSVDSLKLAQRIDRLAQEQGRNPKVCLQVKLASDPNKSGWTVPELLSDLAALNQLQAIAIEGLMIIPPFGLPDAELSALFHAARTLQDQIRQQGFSNIRMRELSMGMSDDYSLAIAAGATMIRPGRALFGERRN